MASSQPPYGLDPNRPEALSAAIVGAGGLVAVVGAGGKKSLIRACARFHPGPLAVTASVFTAPIHRLGPDTEEYEAATAPEAIRAARASAGHRCRCVLGPPARKGRRAPLPGDAIEALHEAGGYHTTLIKADGARMRPVKAPREGEPVLPDATDRVVLILGTSALGLPLDDSHIHRLESVCAVTGLAPGDPLDPDALARLIHAPGGYMEHIRRASGRGAAVPVTLVLNQVDDPDREALAHQVVAHLPESLNLQGVFLTALADPTAPLWQQVA